MNDQPLVCVVDDEETVRNAVARLIRSAGYRVETYASAGELLDAAVPWDDAPAVVVTDYRMPGIDGIALAEQLLAREVAPAVVFLSAHGTIPATVRAMNDGAIDFLEKPVRTEELLNALERGAARSREHISNAESVRELRERYALLTSRERQVYALIVSGLINKEAAWELGISEKTVKVHRGRVVQKMRARSIADLVRMAVSLGIGTPAPALPVRAPV